VRRLISDDERGFVVRHGHWSLSLIGWGFIFTLLLSACTDDRRIVAELMGVPVEKADSHLPHIASLTRRHVCPVE